MARKLKLSLDALEVESFDALPDGDLRGTVAGHDSESETCPSEYETCTLCEGTCVGCRTNAGPNCPTRKLTGPCSC
jgi:hypothetical protein